MAINLFGCQHDLLLEPKEIKRYVKEVIALIHMVAHGPCYIERFGSGSLEGISAMQFIETSSVTVHCDDVGNRVFIDIFSCKDFDAEKAVDFSKQFFSAQEAESTIIFR